MAKGAGSAAPAKVAAKESLKRSDADWERIETDYRIGTRSLREIAADHGITEAAIRKHAKSHDWQRDLGAKVRAKADELVRKAAVRQEATTRGAELTEHQSIEVEATVEARIRLAHRSDIARGRNLAMALMHELEHQTSHQPLYDELAELILVVPKEGSQAAKDRVTKLREIYNRALSLSGRTDTLKKLAETLRILIDKEREAFGIPPPDGTEGAQTPLAQALREFIGGLHQAGSRLPMVARK